MGVTDKLAAKMQGVRLIFLADLVVGETLSIFMSRWLGPPLASTLFSRAVQIM